MLILLPLFERLLHCIIIVINWSKTIIAINDVIITIVSIAMSADYKILLVYETKWGANNACQDFYGNDYRRKCNH